MLILDEITLDSAVTASGARVGHVVGADTAGAPLVDFEGNASGPIAAVVAVYGLRDLDTFIASRPRVVLVFEDGDTRHPLIVGVIADVTASARDDSQIVQQSLEVELDGKAVTIDAREQITLRCGAASLTLRKDGKILLRGSDVTSWATGVNKIKGGAVRIN